MTSSIITAIRIFAILFLPQLLLADSPGKDFLITLDGAKLTGQVQDISFAAATPLLSFENDLGSLFVVHPASIYGFAFVDGDDVLIYESKLLDGSWKFLKVENQDKELTMYTSVERQVKFAGSGRSPSIQDERNAQVWLQFSKDQPFKVYRTNYKGILRKRMSAFPELADRLGKRGFRYKNLPAIVELYNRLFDKRKISTGE